MIKFILIVCLLWPALSYAKALKSDGSIRLFHSHSQEFVEIKYSQDGIMIPEAIASLNKFLRSREDQQINSMNQELIVLLDHLQDHFAVDTIEVICGYRSEAFNKKLYTEGRNVARESYHTMGQAVDIHIDEIPEDVLVQYLKKLNLGGVGYYPRLLMVHADLGLKRFWQEDKFVHRTDIGISPIVLKTDKLFYFAGEKQTIKGEYKGAGLVLEHFFRGKWKVLLEADLKEGDKKNFILSPQTFPKNASIHSSSASTGLLVPYGKFRWKILQQNGSEAYSNEFYFKKKK